MIKRILIFVILIFLTLSFLLVQLGNVSHPLLKQAPLSQTEIEKKSAFFHKNQWGLNQVFLEGNDYERGQQFGFWTKELLFEQEKALVNKLDQVIPYKILQYALVFFSMGWFYGLDDYFKAEWIHEMYGVSHYGSQKNLFFATPFTRQMAYHGIHDLGQMMIDKGLVLGACTQAAIPRDGKGWLVGRNFDFEAGRIFDEEKILKWVYPENGNPFVSVIFSGMVGVITGINSHGVYIAMNAAGSEDKVRLGTPTTLVTLEALQYSTSAAEAVEILKKANSLITDIFVVTDKKDRLYIVEKSPIKTTVLEKTKASVVTNHLQHPDWQNDKVNLGRMKNNTTMDRFLRAKELLPQVKTSQDMVGLLRDKIKPEGMTALGHRASIDALIASHAVVYDSQKMQLFVSKGPSLSREFVGIDLTQSFSNKKPTLIEEIEPDPAFQGIDFFSIKAQIEQLHEVRELASDGNCEIARDNLNKVDATHFSSHYLFAWAEAETLECSGHLEKALMFYKKAFQLRPAYLWEKQKLEKKIETL